VNLQNARCNNNGVITVAEISEYDADALKLVGMLTIHKKGY
jgi:hypothetical protein